MSGSGWNSVPLNSVAEVKTGISKNNKRRLVDPVEMPYLRVANVQDGHLDLSDMKAIKIERAEVDRYLLKSGDVLLTEGGDADKLGRGTVWHNEIDDCLHQNHVFVVRTHHDRLLPDFLSALTGSAYGKSYFLRCAKQSTNLASINSSQLKSFPVLLPSIAEQQAIIDTFREWDVTVALTEQLLVAKTQQRELLGQRLLSGKMRFAQYTQPRQRTTIGSLLAESKMPGSHGRIARKITVKLYGKGVVPKDERSAGSAATKYYQRRAGQFIYSKLDFLNGAFGIIPNELDGYESTLDLPCFDFKGRVDPQYFLYYVSRKSFYARFAGVAVGGRKARRIQVKEFLTTEIAIPHLDEQQHIARTLEACDAELALLDHKRTLFTKQKQALMQQLLTGKVRVPA